MVNVGGPSRGCMTCIQRRIRCGRQRPVCDQCQKSKRQCGGYRNEMDIIFRDQSQTVFIKGIAASHGQATIPQRPQCPENPDSPDINIARHMTQFGLDALIDVRSPKLDEQSGLISFFTNNFTCNDFNRGSNLFWVPRNLDDLLKEDYTRFSVQSVGAMALARLRRSAYYHREAQKNYGLALLSLTKYWQQHVEIVEDAVLVTILFLGFFEILASYDSSSRQSWTTHLGGLGLLLNKREEQHQLLRSDFGAKMLLQSRSQAILSALQTKTPVTEAFRNPVQRIHLSMAPQLVKSDIADKLLIRLAALQARYHTLELSRTLLSELIALDGDFRQWTENTPPSWTFSTQPCNTPSKLWWEARCDVYSTAVIAHVWNKIRAARIVIHDLVQEISMHLPSHHGNNLNFASVPYQINYEIPTPKVRHLVIDICATVPICYRPSSATVQSNATENRPLLGTTYWLLWVLEVIGSMREAPADLTEWVRLCLERIYELTGIVKAQLVARRLKDRQSGVVVP